MSWCLASPTLFPSYTSSGFPRGERAGWASVRSRVNGTPGDGGWEGVELLQQRPLWNNSQYECIYTHNTHKKIDIYKHTTYIHLDRYLKDIHIQSHTIIHSNHRPAGLRKDINSPSPHKHIPNNIYSTEKGEIGTSR